MEFICMFCGKKHTRMEQLVDEHIHCNCGKDFYVFYNQGLVIAMPSEEITSNCVTRAFRNFVTSTGRCQDVRDEPVEYVSFMKNTNPLVLIEVGLERYQEETLGKRFMTCDDVVSICESLNKKRDVAIKDKGGYVDIIELHRKVKMRATNTLPIESIKLGKRRENPADMGNRPDPGAKEVSLRIPTIN